MSYTITNQCIGCNRCLSVCPTGAIQQDGTSFRIDASRCHNCVGFYSVPQCMAACPTNGGCIPDPQEFWERWFNKYDRLVTRLRQAERTQYWEQWFEQYARQIAGLIQEQADPV